VVAEGIETHAQLEFLQELGCEFGQGYFISRPLEIADLNKWLQQHGKNFYQSETYLDYLADNDNKD